MKANRFLTYVVLCGFALLLGSLCEAAVKTIARDDPEKMLRQATDELLSISKAARGYVKEDRQRYYDEVAAVLDQVIDKDYFARGVMAVYGSGRMYKSLQTDAERAAFRNRVKTFADSLQDVLIEKYADALLAFDGERIEVESAIGSNPTEGKASLLQTIYDTGNKVYRVQYNLNKNKQENWLINNIIVEGVNLGATYRNQFAEAVERNRGDVDYVVNNWKTLMAPVAEEKTAGGNDAAK